MYQLNNQFHAYRTVNKISYSNIIHQYFGSLPDLCTIFAQMDMLKVSHNESNNKTSSQNIIYGYSNTNHIRDTPDIQQLKNGWSLDEVTNEKEKLVI